MAEEIKKDIEEETEEIADSVKDEDTEEELEEAAESPEDDDNDDEDEAEDRKAEIKESKIVDDILEIVESTLLTVFVIIMIFTYLLHPVTVSGPSMLDTLTEDDRVFMTTVYRGPHYGDIIIINNDYAYLYDENGKVYKKDISYSRLKECIIKRVIAEPGQTIDIDTEREKVIVDGKELDEPYIRDNMNITGEAFDFPLTVPEGYYFVMGDNRQVSADSRHPEVGFIKKDQIYGKAIVRYAPISEFKFLIFKNKNN